LSEWAKVLQDHPKFARAFLAQQAILIEASELRYRLIDARMCKLLELGFVGIQAVAIEPPRVVA